MFLKRLGLANDDVVSGVKQYRIWLYMAWQDTKQRYRRSIIGPFWITITTGIMVIAMGPLYGALLNQEIGPYIQHLSISLIIWNFISGYINEACTSFISSEGYIKQIKLPLSIFLMRVLAKNVIALAHNAVIIIIVLIFFPPSDLGLFALLPVGLILVIGNLFWIGLMLAIICTRFRDIPLLVANILQVIFFVSPILWKVDMLGRNQYVADYNPIYHFIEIIRAPLLSQPASQLSWVVSLTLLALGSIATILLFSRFRSRIPYWL